MDYSIFPVIRQMGLSLQAQRAVNELGSAPSQEKRSKIVAGCSLVLVMGNLDREEQSCV